MSDADLSIKKADTEPKLDYGPAVMTGFFVFLAVWGSDWLPPMIFALMCAGAAMMALVGLMSAMTFRSTTNHN